MSTPQLKRKRNEHHSPPHPKPVKLARTAKTQKTDDDLQSYVGKHSVILQGTKEWLMGMLTSIGGSQIAAAVGMNRYMTREQLIEKIKAGNPFEPSLACEWGKLFEPVIRAYIAFAYSTRIHGHDICILDGNLRFSPDGICILPNKNGGRDVTLLEFKCPYTRRPDGTIPKHYQPQLWLGLAMTAEIEPTYALFIDAVFRRCREDQLGDTPDYDTCYHARDQGIYGKPIAWGVLNVYSKDTAASGAIKDYGAAGRKIFNGMLMKISKGEMAASLLYLHVNGKEEAILNPQGHVEGMQHVGIIPFKLMEVYTRKENPVDGFLERARGVVNKIFIEVNKK